VSERAHAAGSKPPGDRAIWRIFNAEGASAGKSIRPARICHILQVEEVGNRGLAEAAGIQRGMIHRSQLISLGITRGSIAHRVRTGTLHPVFPSVWAVGHPALTPEALETAALLYAGADTVLSHASAGAVWRLVDRPEEVQVTVAGRRVRHRAALRVHRVAVLDARDVRLRHGIPVTSPARTMIDLAGSLDDDLEIERALAELRVLGLARDAELRAAMDRCPGRAGVARLRALLDAERPPALTRSEAERRMLALCDRAGLPRPVVGARPCGFPVDFLWPQTRLVVEVDGLAFHGHRRAFETDRRRDQILVAAGYRVVRVTWRQLSHEPLAVMVRIAQALVVTADDWR
jgi:hypothetical protein